MDSPRSFLPSGDVLQQHFLRRDSQGVNDTAPGVVLTALPFNHLGVWAYIAIGFIILSSSMVLCYVTYTCCYSAWQRQYYNPEPRSNTGRKIITVDSVIFSGTNPNNEVIHNRRLCWAKAKSLFKRGEKETVADWNAGDGKPSRRWLSSKENAWTKTDSLLSTRPSTSNAFSGAYTQSFEMEPFPVPERVLDIAGSYSGSHSPYNCRPRSFASTSDNDCIQNHYSAPCQAPPSPAPSYTLNPNTYPVTAEIHDVPRHHSKRGRLHGLAAVDIDNPFQTPERRVEFDSNNIRYATPPNPFISREETIWNEPKLSPIGGAIISPTLPMSGSGEGSPVSPFISSRLVDQRSPPASPALASPRKSRLLSPQSNPRVMDDDMPGQLAVDMKNPISRPVYLHVHQGQ